MDWKSWVVTVVVGGLGTVLMAVGAKVYAWLSLKAKSAGAALALNALYAIVEAAVAHAQVELKPELQSIASNALNGRLSASDAAQLKAAVMRIVKDMASDLLPKLEKYVGLTSGSQIDTMISGMIERAVSAIGPSWSSPVTDPVAASIGRAAAALSAAPGSSVLKVTPASTMPQVP